MTTVIYFINHTSYNDKRKHFPVKALLENETHPPYYMHSDMFGKSSTTRECVDSRGVSVCILVSLYHINKQTKDTQDLQCFLKPNL